MVAAAVILLAGWQGVTTVGRAGALDTLEHIRYADYLGHHHRPPPASENYEYASPPLYQALAAVAERAVDVLPAARLELSSNALTRALWLALVAAGAACMTAARGGVRALGLAILTAAAAWGLDEAVLLGRSLAWSAGQLLSLGLFLALTAATALLARELWPEHRAWRVGAAAALLAFPAVFRMGVLFHPETLFAVAVATALVLYACAARRGWGAWWGAGAGAACGLAALTRQSAVVAAFCVVVAALAAGRRHAAGFAAAAVVALALVAGPWWGYVAHRFGNPLQSNLDRPGQMIDRQPASFFVSAPLASLVGHPYRPDFQNELLPKLHADLWSDWFGALHDFWQAPSRLDRVTASTQSVLGFGGDALALAGLAVAGVPAAARAARRRARGPTDATLALLALLAVCAFVAYVLTLVRFPQAQGDPIKSTYLLFTAPAWAVFVVAAWTAATRRFAAARVLLPVWAALYGVSYAVHLGAALS